MFIMRYLSRIIGSHLWYVFLILMVHSKHLFIPNFVGSSLKCGYAKITAENRNLIESCYEARCVVALLKPVFHDCY
jgi:hypothetical protein